MRHARLGHAQQRNADLETETDYELRKRLDDMETELQQTQVKEVGQFHNKAYSGILANFQSLMAKVR